MQTDAHMLYTQAAKYTSIWQQRIAGIRELERHPPGAQTHRNTGPCTKIYRYITGNMPLQRQPQSPTYPDVHTAKHMWYAHPQPCAHERHTLPCKDM